MTIDAGTPLADAIAQLSAAWATYSETPQRLTDPRPDPGPVLEAAALVRAQMPDVDPATGMLPWETDEDLDPEPPLPPAPEWAGAAFEVLYEVSVLNRATTLANQTYHLGELGNAVGDLVTWHPGYDYERGQIVPVAAD